jgi:UDP-N-acetylglucosamine 2-epimerase (hydrolysing)
LQRKKIAFLTGTRADYGKIKGLINSLDSRFDALIIVTGMHLLELYGSTVKEIRDDDLARIVTFKNQEIDSSMEEILARTIANLSPILRDEKVDLLVIHGDRVETMAGALTAALMNTRVAHIEGGENSGTIDNLLRHSISKLCQHHFVTNDKAAETIQKLGESPSQIYVIGSPDLDIISKGSIPSISEVRSHYQIDFESFGILLVHPVTTELESLSAQMDEICDAVSNTDIPWVVIQPNNDMGSGIVRAKINKLSDPTIFKHIPSMRFEYFISLMKSSLLLLGNSSAGIMEAPNLGIPSVNIGTRQRNRFDENEIPSIINANPNRNQILEAITRAKNMKVESSSTFGDGNAARRFNEILLRADFWGYSLEKLDSRH